MNEGSVRTLMAKMGIVNTGRVSARGWIDAPCPFAPWRHKSGTDRHPSFGIHVHPTGRSYFKCMTCKATGSVTTLATMLGNLRGVDYGPIAREAEASDKFGTSLPSFDSMINATAIEPEPLDEDAFGDLFSPPDEWPREAIDFLQSRGVGLKTAEIIGLGYDPDKKRITFPVRDEAGRLFGWSGRTIIPNHKPKVLDYMGLPKERMILGVHAWRQGVPKLLVEGLFAYARCIENGALEYCDVGALLGAELTPGKAEILKRHLATQVFLMDPDKAGVDATWGPEAVEKDRWGKQVHVRQFEKGIVGKLYRHTMLVVPQFPDLSPRAPDVDNLTPEELRSLVCGSPVFMPNKVFRERMAAHELGLIK